MVFGDGVVGRQLRLDKVMRVGPWWWDKCPYKEKGRGEREREQWVSLQAQRKGHMKMQQRQLSATHGERTIPRQWPCWHLDPGFPASRTVRKLSHPLLFGYSSLAHLRHSVSVEKKKAKNKEGACWRQTCSIVFVPGWSHLGAGDLRFRQLGEFFKTAVLLTSLVLIISSPGLGRHAPAESSVQAVKHGVWSTTCPYALQETKIKVNVYLKFFGRERSCSLTQISKSWTLYKVFGVAATMHVYFYWWLLNDFLMPEGGWGVGRERSSPPYVCMEKTKTLNYTSCFIVVVFSKHEGSMTSWYCVWGNAFSVNKHLKKESFQSHISMFCWVIKKLIWGRSIFVSSLAEWRQFGPCSLFLTYLWRFTFS